MKHVIAMVSDFFYPNVGGVENHIYQLAQCLLARGHTVIIITHAYKITQGLRFFKGPSNRVLKVYYLPLLVFYNQCVLPTILCTFPLFRMIFQYEKITIVHGHSSFSTLAHEAMFHAKTMGIRTVFTDHSLFGFADASSILTNKILELSLADVTNVICVSHTSKENTVLRANLKPANVYVVPNAIDPSEFKPTRKCSDPNHITVIVMSRLVYRKGMDLLAGLIPIICNRHQHINFIIGGDGPKRLLLEEMRENYQLHDRVTFLGALPYKDVPGVLNMGDIFINTSLTEAFCMAIVEAACCGLQVVSTSVGGIPEVLPDDLISLAQPNIPSLVAALEEVIIKIKNEQVLPRMQIHERVLQLYTWSKVAKRTDNIYNKVMKKKLLTLDERLSKFDNCGPVIGKLFMILIIINEIVFKLLKWLKSQKV